MAVIKNQKTGMWEVRTYYKDWTGARKQKTKRGFVKKSEALKWERNFKLKEDQSISMSFKSFVDIYLTDLEPRIKRNTFLTKKHIIETKILPYFGKRKLDEIRTADVIQWQNEIMKLTKDNGELFSPTYLKTIHNQLSAILNHAVNMYGLKDNVARKAGTMGKEESKKMEFWTQDEFQAFLECVADKPMSYYAFEILYWTGICEGELLALTLEDFNSEKKTLRINKSYQRLEGKNVITDLKTPKSNRTIVMPDFLATEMEDFISRLYEIEKDERIFTISKSYLHHEMDRGAKFARVKRIRIHGLRHSHVRLPKGHFETVSFFLRFYLGFHLFFSFFFSQFFKHLSMTIITILCSFLTKTFLLFSFFRCKFRLWNFKLADIFEVDINLLDSLTC